MGSYHQTMDTYLVLAQGICSKVNLRNLNIDNLKSPSDLRTLVVCGTSSSDLIDST